MATAWIANASSPRPSETSSSKRRAALTENQVFNLILAPGFSTAEKVTDLSGRGVGLDVVRRNVEKLRGKIEILSTPGHGSTFRIHLPLTLAIIDGLMVGAGDQRYIVPSVKHLRVVPPVRRHGQDHSGPR